MSISYWQNTITNRSLTADAVIVGGGIAGLSCAYWLEKNPNGNYILVDRHKFGFGASGRNAGFVTCGSAEHFSKLRTQFGDDLALKIWKFSEDNKTLLESEIIKTSASETDFKQTGSCTVAASPEDWQRYQQLAGDMNRLGIDVRVLDSKKMSENYSVRGFHGGIEYLGDGVVHPLKLLSLLKSKLKRTQIIESEEVFKIEKSNEWCVQTENLEIKVQKVIVAVNGYLGLVMPEWKQIVKPQRGQVLVTEPLKIKVKGPCYLTKHLCYFRQMPTGELLIGGFRNLDLESENTFLDQTSEKIQSALFKFAKEFFELPESIGVRNQWSGIMGFTPDGQMIIGEPKGTSDLHIMAGCSGHGMGISFHAAKVLVDSIFGAQIPKHLEIKRYDASE